MTNPARLINRRLRSGFTLIEILIVMGIIVLMIALALPAFNFITGARSVEASTNQLGAVLGIARSDAIGIQQLRGVVVFHDAKTGKDAIGEAELRTYPFNGYVPGVGGATPSPVSYALGQYVMYTDSKAYVCINAYADIADPTTVPNYANSAYWRVMTSATAPTYGLVPGDQVLELRFDREYQTFPVGIGIRAAGNSVKRDYGGSNYNQSYFNPGAVFFDSNGQVVLTNYYVLFEGMLAERMGAQIGQMSSDPPTPDSVSHPFSAGSPLGKNLVAGSNPLQSQIGFVFFNTEHFSNVAGGFNPASQDAWLDQNASPVMVNRYNGTLVKGE